MAALLLAVLAGAVHGAEWGLAARVNASGIPVSRLDRTFDAYLADKAIDPGGFRDPQRYKRIRQQVLELLITHELLYQDAQAKGLVPDDAALAQAIAQVKDSYPSAADFRLELRQRDLTGAQFAEDLRRRLAVKRLVDEDIAGAIQVTDAEVHAFYVDNEARLRTPEEVRARHILIRLPADAAEAQTRAARARIDAIAARLREGADFEALAREHSEDGSAVRGGDLGFATRGRYVPAFEQAVFGLAPGERSGVVRTEFGFHLIRVEERRGGTLMPEDALAQRIREHLRAAKVREAMEARVAALREAGSVEVLVRR